MSNPIQGLACIKADGVEDEKQTVGSRDAAIEPPWMGSRRVCVRPDSGSRVRVEFISGVVPNPPWLK